MMLPGEFVGCPFERRIVGCHGAILLRRNRPHIERAVSAINHRAHPAWSQLAGEVRVEGAA